MHGGSSGRNTAGKDKARKKRIHTPESHGSIITKAGDGVKMGEVSYNQSLSERSSDSIFLMINNQILFNESNQPGVCTAKSC